MFSSVFDTIKYGGKMLKLSKIDENLNIYRNASILVIFGTGSAGQRLYQILKYFGIEIDYFSDNNSEKWNKTLYRKTILSPRDLKDLYNKSPNMLIQIASRYSNEIMKQLEESKIFHYIDYFEARTRLEYIKYNNLLGTSNELLNFLSKNYLKSRKGLFENFYFNGLLEAAVDTMYIQCQPMKTANNTIGISVQKTGAFFTNSAHTPQMVNLPFLKQLGFKNIKLITAVREPISQNLSALFQVLSGRPIIFQYLSQSKLCPEGDVQIAFERLIESKGYYNFGNDEKDIGKQFIQNTFHPYLIQDFIEEFKQNIFDLTSVNFDKEKGYSVIKLDGLEIFVFKLENLNSISQALFDWIGYSEGKLINSNEASEKWSGSLYNQAKKEIKFTEEYYIKCYNEPYVKHFYSDDEIFEFKEKWKNNIL